LIEDVEMSDEPVHVLCPGPVNEEGVSHWTSGDFIMLPSAEWDPDPHSHKGIFGLLMGVGDLNKIARRTPIWAVMKVHEYIHVKGETKSGHVKFKYGTVVFAGDLPDAIDRLVQLGADPERLALQLHRGYPFVEAPAGGYAVADKHGGVARTRNGVWAGAPSFSVAIADSYLGTASVGDYGVAWASYRGQAVAGFAGFAIAKGEKGRDSGSAKAGDAGVAIGDDAVAGAHGKAIGAESAKAGDAGVAIGNVAVAGADGMAIGWATAKIEGNGTAIGRIVSGGVGSLLIAWGGDDNGEKFCATGIVGKDGIEPNVQYCAVAGSRTLTVVPSDAS
jgi:hypothetical protein